MQRPPSQIIQTARGELEYAMRGQGPVVILYHGTGGGYDQGLVPAKLLNGFQAIAVSRAGYLRTPSETGHSPAEMADAYATLLDVLNIEKAAIPVEYSHAVALRIPNAEIAVIQGGGHECLVSRQREVTPLLNTFLAKHGAT